MQVTIHIGGRTLSKKDWIEVFKMVNEKDWSDWIVFTVSLISSVLVLVSVVYSAKAAKAAKSTVDLSLRIHNEQKESTKLEERKQINRYNKFYLAKTIASLNFTEAVEKRLVSMDRHSIALYIEIFKELKTSFTNVVNLDIDDKTALLLVKVEIHLTGVIASLTYLKASYLDKPEEDHSQLLMDVQMVLENQINGFRIIKEQLEEN